MICGEVNGEPFFKPGKEGYDAYLLDVNQAARTRSIENPSGHTPAFDIHRRDAIKRLEGTLGRVPSEFEIIQYIENRFPNSRWDNVHGEGGALHQLQQLLDELGGIRDLARGAEVELWVYGNKVCSHCQQALKEIAKNFGIKKLTLIEMHVSEDGFAGSKANYPQELTLNEGDSKWTKTRAK